MSLFREIRRLCLAGKEQPEDILTEIVSEVLRNNHELTRTWFEKLEIEGGADAKIHSVETQYRVPGLPDHDTDNPDHASFFISKADTTHPILGTPDIRNFC